MTLLTDEGFIGSNENQQANTFNKDIKDFMLALAPKLDIYGTPDYDLIVDAAANLASSLWEAREVVKGEKRKQFEERLKQ